MTKNNVCFVTVATNKYFILAQNLAESIKKYFYSGADFVVFTNNEDKTKEFEWVKYFKVDHRPWPQSSACKFEHILSQNDYFSQYDYLYFIDADMLLCDSFSLANIWPDTSSGLVGVKHPAWEKFMGPRGDVEENPNSTAYIPQEIKLDCYYQGCFWGGETEKVLEMCKVLKEQTEFDYSRGINTKWFDESQINWYFVYHKPRILGSNYCCPEKDFARYGLYSDNRILHVHKNAEEIRKLC